jgi:hypothetical protein
MEATVSLLTAALQRIRADAIAEVLGWPGGCCIAAGLCLYIAAANLARNVSEWRDWNGRTGRLPLVNNCWLPLDWEGSRIWRVSSGNSAPNLIHILRAKVGTPQRCINGRQGPSVPDLPPLTHEHAAGRVSEIAQPPSAPL